MMKSRKLASLALWTLACAIAPNVALAVTPCGHEGDRACCFLEPNPDGIAGCAKGLVEVPGCGGDCSCQGGAFPSSGTCVRPSPCGGPGQRACCALERVDGKACVDDSWPELGCAGDCTCGYNGALAATGTCKGGSAASMSEPETDANAEPSQGNLRGYADLHVHLFAHVAHGGLIFSGKPYDEQGGVAAALSAQWDRDLHGAHGLGNDTLGSGTKDFDSTGGLSENGAPLFNGWPTWHSTTHQQVYYKWLMRAWQGGLRLISALAVTNEALCKSKMPKAYWSYCEDSMASIDEQLLMTKDMEAFIDKVSGGEGKGWFRIVTTPAEARDVIAAGKLAVVLGIEVDNLFNCREEGGCPVVGGETPEQYVTRKVDEYYIKGVRHIFPIHNFDNAFGYPATWQDTINLGNKVVTGDWWAVENCPTGYDFKLLDSYGDKYLINLAQLFGFGLATELPNYDGYTSTCHMGGLNPLGAVLIEKLVEKHMMIDVDHMSNHAVDATLGILEKSPGGSRRWYPVVASHVQFQELNEATHERMRTRAQLERIRGLGGMIAAMTKDDAADTNDLIKKLTIPYGVVSDTCRHSSRTFAQAYQYAVDVMDAPVALGSDFNGVAAHVGPRFGHQACGACRGDNCDPASNDAIARERSAQEREKNRLDYPFTIEGFGEFNRQKTGERTFDFNTDGLAHIGLLPDLIADMENVGLPAGDVDRLFQSAEAFVKLWERAEDGGAHPPPGTCLAVNVTADAGADCKADAKVLDPALYPAVDKGELSWSQSPAGPYPLHGTDVLLTVAETGSSTSASCTGTVTVVDKTAPVLSCPSVTAECKNLHAIVDPPPEPALLADNCGDAQWLQCERPATSEFPLGETKFACTVSDGASNQTACAYSVKVKDTVKPEIICPAEVNVECTGVNTVVALGQPDARDACSGVTLTNDAPASFPVGDNLVVHSAKDTSQNSAKCEQSVRVQDTTPPKIASVAASPNTLWAPNHKMVDVAVAVAATDICDPTVPVCKLTSILISEPPNARGDGATSGDALITGPLSARLRAERSGQGNGRVYALNVRCTDHTGNASTTTTEVRVSANQGP